MENQFKRLHENISTFHLRQFARGYVTGLKDKLESYSLDDEFDEWCAYCEQVDINFYMHRGIITATAYLVAPNGVIQTDKHQEVYIEKLKLKGQNERHA